MSEGDGNSAEELSTQLKTIQEALSDRGFDSADALLSDRDSIAEERDKLKENNDKAQKIIQKQGSELGELRKQSGVTPPAKPNEDRKEKEDAPQEPTIEQELASLEQSMTQEQRERADEFLESIEDEAMRDKIVTSPEKRLEALKEVSKTFKPKRKSFWEKPQEGGSPKEGGVATLFNEFKQRKGYTPDGPQGGSGGPGKPPATEKKKSTRTF